MRAGHRNGHYHGLLVDYGGVLTTNLFDSFRAFCRAEDLDPATITQLFRQDRSCRELLIGLETGELPEQEFEPQFAAMLGVAHEGLIDRRFAGCASDETMLSAVVRARQAGICTGLISNSWGTRRYDRTRLSEWFDGLMISGEVGIRKPAPQIYELGAESVGLAPGDCVFVDDVPFNLGPAGALGMATVQHIHTRQTLDELERLLGMCLR
jgi:epoxide hydrolase-like predicted phosphatase